MKRVQGSADLPLVECINHRLKKYRVRWDMQPYINEKDEVQGVTFIEKEFTHKPTIQEIKDVILSWMNEQIDTEIISGFVWNGMPVWLSTENQFNYKATYDLAVQTEGMSLPTTFKFGNSDTPVYYEFRTLEDISDFYLQAMNFVNRTLAKGWQKKDSFDWDIYENEK